jgi:hypothetical protein
MSRRFGQTARRFNDFKHGINNTGKMLNFAGRVAQHTSAHLFKTAPKATWKIGKAIAYTGPKSMLLTTDKIVKKIDKTVKQFNSPIVSEPLFAEARMSARKAMTSAKEGNFWQATKHTGAATLLHSPIGTLGKGLLMSGGMYGLMAYASDDASKSTGDRAASVGKHGIAAVVDATADFALSGVADGIGMLGPYGMMAAAGIRAYNFGANFVGLDLGSLALRAMDSMDERYNQDRGGGKKFSLSENSSMALQRQISNIHQSGSNMAEVMHNFSNNRDLDDYIQDNKSNKSKKLYRTECKHTRRKMAPTLAI